MEATGVWKNIDEVKSTTLNTTSAQGNPFGKGVRVQNQTSVQFQVILKLFSSVHVLEKWRSLFNDVVSAVVLILRSNEKLQDNTVVVPLSVGIEKRISLSTPFIFA
jgi:hypothetical protein